MEESISRLIYKDLKWNFPVDTFKQVCDGTAVLAKYVGDSASNPLIVPQVGYIFRWHDRFAICPPCGVRIQTTDQLLIGVPKRWVNEWNHTNKKVKKKK